jgi:membrane-bound metal-dependent hydrolase YbcI (DUF457 family)
MNTPAHIVVNLTILGREEKTDAIVPVAVGALLPDLPMMVFYAYAKLFSGISESVIWSETYHAAGWQTLFDLFNSLPIIAAGYIAARLAGARRMALLFTSMALHCLGDLLLHHDDAHRHLFPLSNWRFSSPVSYWDPQHFGNIAGLLEAAAVIAGCIYLLRNSASVKARLLVGGLAGSYAVYWGYVAMVWM